MFRRVFLTAVIAGLVAGLAAALLQEVVTTPLILEAERYEAGAGTAGDAPAQWSPAAGLERLAYTLLSDLLVGVGFALILAACLALHGIGADGRTGLLWGAAGFATFTLAPSLGLPPEIPGAAAADLHQRQFWWLAAAAATALALWLMVFGRRAWMPLLGILLLALPHLVGAPHPERAGGAAAPAELAGQFAAASIVVAALFWAVLGWTAGTAWRRLG